MSVFGQRRVSDFNVNIVSNVLLLCKGPAHTCPCRCKQNKTNKNLLLNNPVIALVRVCVCDCVTSFSYVFINGSAAFVVRKTLIM